MKVLGIDPGTTVLGYGLVATEAGSLHYVAHGTIAPSGVLPLRLMTLYDGLAAVIAQHAPQTVVMESPFLAKNVASALKLGQVQGVVLLAAAHAALPACTYSPMEIKSAVAGYGKATKNQVQEMVRRLLGFQQDLSLDASDALAAAICHIHTSALQDRWQQHSSGVKVS